MIETALIVEALAIVAVRVLQGAGDDYLKGKLRTLLKAVKGKKKSPQAAGVAQSYERLCETVSLGLNLLGEDPGGYKDDLTRFIEDPAVFLEFLKPFDSPTSTVSINDEFLAGRWVDLGLKRMPVGFPWNTVAQVYKNNAQKLMTTTPELQGIAQVQELRAIRDELRKHGPVVPGQNLADYRDYLRSYYRVLDLSALAPARHDEARELSVTEVFVPQSVRTSRPPLDLPKEVLDKLRGEGELAEDEPADGVSPEELELVREAYFREETRPVLDVISDPHNRLTVILGDPGSGKSTLTRYLSLSLIDPPANQAWVRPFEGHLPLLVELRDFFAEYQEKHCDSFLGYLEYLGRTRNYALNAADTDEYLRADGRALVIFDGLDEIFDPGAREQVADWIAGFALHYSRVRVIVTSRIIGYDPKPLAKADFALHTLQDLDDERIKTFARGWYDLTFPGKADEADRRYERLIRSIEGSSSIKQLAGNPMLLTILAIIGRNRELPRERWRLYDHAADVLVHHWDVERHRLEAHLTAEFMNEEDKKQLLRAVAHHMQRGEHGLAGNTITNDELEGVFTRYFESTWKLAHKESVTLARKMIDQFHARNFILCKRGPRLFGFVHRAFLEYFCAAEFVERRRNTEDFTLEHMQKLFRNHWKDKNWHEVLRLICGMESDAYAARLVRTLAFDVEEWSSNTGKPPWSLVLSVQCFGEMDKLGVDEDLGADMLQQVFRAVEQYCGPGENHPFLYESLVPAVADIGLRWPGRESVLDWCLSSYPSKTDSWARALEVIFLAHLQRDHHHTPSFLRDRAVTDEHEYVRHTALRELARGWPDDPHTLSLLRDRAVNDENGYVRSTAFSELAKGWRDDPRTPSLLRKQAVHDKNYGPRSTALSELAKGWPDDSEVQDFVRQQHATG